MADFTLLMSVYAGDKAEFLRAALESATTAQTLPPTRVVIVRDGPVGADVQAVLDEYGGRPQFEVVPLERNGGLAGALNAGLAHVATPLVARMDADDICAPQRFERQLPLFEAGCDVVGAAITEFTDDVANPGMVRHVRTDPDEIARAARTASPLHHPTVMFRAAVVAGVGGYPELARMEDYLLWAKLIMAGARVGNVDEPLVYYRVGAGAYARRGGMAMWRSERALQAEFLRMGFTTRAQWARNLVLRGPLYRLMPQGLRQVGYRLWRRAGG